MKPLIAVVAGILLLIAVICHVRVSYVYDRDIGSYWSLSEKASTIEKKSEYMDRFVDALEKSGAMHGHNALVFKTPDNSLEQNMVALRSLRDRLHQIRGMDVQSVQYQAAISQITAQEQGEGEKMIDVLESGWVLHSGYWYLWNWVGGFIVLGLIGVGVASVATIAKRPRSAMYHR